MANNIAYTIPVPGTTPGPDYATEISAALLAIQYHNHDGVNNGTTINIAGQIIQGDLSLDGYNLSNDRAVQFISQPSVLSGSQDVNCIYVNQNNLGYNNSNGVFVPITNGNTLAVTTLPFTNLTPRNVSASFSILTSDTYNLVNIDSTGGPVTGTLPICAAITPTAAGRLYLFRDVGGFAAVNNITIQVAVGSGNLFADSLATSFVMSSPGAYVALYTDGASKWFTWSQNTFNGEFTQMNGGGMTLAADAQLAITGTSSIQVDSSSEVSISGLLDLPSGSTLFATGMTGTITGATTITWSGTASETKATGTTSTFASGSNLVLDGALNGTTNGGSLTLGATTGLTLGNPTTVSVGGLLTVNGVLQGSTFGGNLTLNNHTLNVPNILNLNGGQLTASSAAAISLTGSSTISGNRSTTITNNGLTNMFGSCVATTLLNAGTYTVDSGTNYDYYIGIKTASTGNWTINMPPSPTEGRRLIIQDCNGINESTPPSYSIVIAGNGHQLSFNNGPGGIGGTVTLITLNAATDILSPFWSYSFIFTNNIWISTALNKFA